MPHTYTNLVYHVIFGTKDRRPLLDGITERLYQYMIGIVSNLRGNTLAINGTTDHVHVLISLPADVPITEFVRTLKAGSSKWVHEEFSAKLFQWQNGYSAFTVSHSQIPTVSNYIAGQAEHHKTVSFEEEFTAFLKKHGVEYDPRYIWS
jgi:REP element-mobilizing transposase RayT